MNKVIHYVWVGDNRLPRLAKKCIKSWKKYLPDWEIIEWNEQNFDIENSVPFVKEAYAQKKWAFVADYIRTKVLYEHGGIYFDTDMEVLGDIGKFLEKPAFLGREYEGDSKDMVCAGVIYVAKKHDPFIKEMLDFYEKQPSFNASLMYKNAIPKIITKILEKYPHSIQDDGIEIFDERIWVYPKDYFYPVSFDWSKEFYSHNTVMIHHYDASWTGLPNKRNVMIRKTFPEPLASIIFIALRMAGRTKHLVKHRSTGLQTQARTIASIHLKQNVRLQKLAEDIANSETNDYLVISNPNWIGVSHVAEDLLGGYVPLKETHIYKQGEIDRIASALVKANKKLIVFNGLASGWERVIRAIRELDNKVTIKTLHHGGDVRLARWYDYEQFMKKLGLYNVGLVNELGFVKKQQAEFYKQKGFRTSFVANNIFVDNPSQYKKPRSEDGIKIGLYCSGDIEWKNAFNQVAAASLVKNATLDVVPLSHAIGGYADKLHVHITGSDTLLPRDELFARVANNDVNLHVSFAEASPLLPLESMELGVPCITANNHHYWQGTPLEEYLVVSRPDDMLAIHEQIVKVLKNRDEIMKLYREWKPTYDQYSKKSVAEFLKA